MANHCLRSTSYVNLIVIDKQPQLQWLTMERPLSTAHAAPVSGKWAERRPESGSPTLSSPRAGDIVTMEVVAAARILRERLPQLRTRVVNVVDLMTLIRPKDHPHGTGEVQFAELFTESVDVIFAFHGFPGGFTRCCTDVPMRTASTSAATSRRTTTTPFDMTVSG